MALVGDRSSVDFEADPDRRDALLRSFTVPGEAVGEWSDEIKHDHPEVGRASPVRMRNRIVHGYWSIDLDVPVTTARDDLGRFLDAVRSIPDEEPGAAGRT